MFILVDQLVSLSEPTSLPDIFGCNLGAIGMETMDLVELIDDFRLQFVSG